MGISRNDPCPCGSGKKHKKCCLINNKEPKAQASPALMDSAFALHQAGQLDQAAALYQQVLTSEPQHGEALHLYGALHLQNQNYTQAIELIQRAIQVCGPQRDFLYNLGNALRGARQDKEAISVYRQILQEHPHDLATLNNLGLAYRDARQPSNALSCFEAARRSAPDDPELLSNLGLTLAELNHIDEAIVCYRQALALNPNLPVVCNNLGTALLQTGDIEAALVVLRRALDLRPNYAEAHSNLVFCLDFLESSGSAGQQAERRRWAEQHTAHIVPYQDFTSQREAGRKLRIGYISADFRRHSAANAFGPLLLHYDAEQFETICFSNSNANDDLSERFRAAATSWHDIYALDDKTAAALIKAQAIDILVDLGGHARDNRLGVMAYRPAPVQASGWGHANGTGLATVDYLFADAIYIPPSEAALYREKLCYIPCTLGYLPHANPPPITPLPALKNGYVSFGSFSRLSKINAASLQAWIALLKEIPDSRIVFKAAELSSPERQSQLLAQFVEQGIDAARVTLLGNTDWHEHLRSIGEVDIALDPFPHGGGITVFDCLLMGVPVLAVSRPMPTGRLAPAILHTVQLDDWISDSAEQLLALAAEKSRDLSSLSALRSTLCERLCSTTAGDPQRYAQAVETQYLAIWQHWLATTN